MAYEVTTPVLKQSIGYATEAIDGVLDGSLEPKIANTVISGARALQSGVREDVRTRLAQPKIDLVEEKAKSKRARG